ncbi:MAG: phosphotransferase [Roseiflexaceae bacterium]
MSEPISHSPEDISAIVERILSETFGGAVELDRAEALQEREHVARFVVHRALAGAPASVVVKRARAWEGQTYDPDSSAPRSVAAHLFNDWVGLQLLSEASGADTIAPRFYGGDRAAGLFVIEDLGAGVSPDEALLGDDPAAAEESMVALARMLGRMHGATIGWQARYTQMRSALGPYVPDYHDYRWLVDGFLATTTALDVPLRNGVTADLETLIDALSNPGPFLAYTHGDPCPDNWVWAGDRLRLFDFEAGGFRHALTDGVYGRIHFPSCWCVNRLPDHIQPLMESAYRTELSRGCPAAQDDLLFGRAVVEACAYWTLSLCSRNRRTILELMDADLEWGISTVRQRVLLRADILAQITAERGHLVSLGAVFADMAAKLRARWPTDADAMPYYPAFRANGTRAGLKTPR